MYQVLTKTGYKQWLNDTASWSPERKCVGDDALMMKRHDYIVDLRGRGARRSTLSKVIEIIYLCKI